MCNPLRVGADSLSELEVVSLTTLATNPMAAFLPSFFAFSPSGGTGIFS